MSDDSYLWDKSGRVDPFIAKLERSLTAKRGEITRSRRGRLRLLRTATAVALVAAALVIAWVCFGHGAGDASDTTSGSPPIAVEKIQSTDDGSEPRPEVQRNDTQEAPPIGTGTTDESPPVSDALDGAIPTGTTK